MYSHCVQPQVNATPPLLLKIRLRKCVSDTQIHIRNSLNIPKNKPVYTFIGMQRMLFHHPCLEKKQSPLQAISFTPVVSEEEYKADFTLKKAL